MATGTGKTAVAFQLCWKLWNARWNRTGEFRKPRILYLADRNIFVESTQGRHFCRLWRCPLQDRVWRGCSSPRDMYFALYQALAEDERREGLFKAFASDTRTSFYGANANRRFPVGP